MPKVRLQHNGKSVSVNIDPDAAKVQNHNPLRFRISHDVQVNTGINTWFMSRKQVEEISLEVLTEILEAKQPGSEEVVHNAERRVESGQETLVKAVQQIGRLTHPDVMMLIDMRQNPNQYVNSSSAFANMFNALARKVMDLSFYATLIGPNPNQQREDFIRTTGAVTRGMDQFVYCRPNPSAANPYVNFSVIPAGQNYEDVRFPTHYEPRTQTKEKIPKMRFREIYAYYLNELFDCYRRYLRMLGAAEILPGNMPVEAPGDASGNEPDSDPDSDDGVEKEMLDSMAESVPDVSSSSVKPEPESVPDVSSSSVKPPRSSHFDEEKAVNKVVLEYDLNSLASKQLLAAVEEITKEPEKYTRDYTTSQLNGLLSGKTKGKDFLVQHLKEALIHLKIFDNLKTRAKK